MLERFRRLTRAALRHAARDGTGAAAARSALVLAPHPDDETLGCGATILRKVAAGTPVTIAVMTDGRGSHRGPHLPPEALVALRRAEMAEAVRRLGLDPSGVRWAGFVDGTLRDRAEELTSFVADLIAEVRPEEVYTTAADEPHPDHAALGRAVRRALATAPASRYATQARILEYPVWLWGSWPARRGDRIRSSVRAIELIARRRAVTVRAGAHLAGKLYALEAHASQLRRPDAVPPDQAWPTLPPAVLAAAADSSELFLPVEPGTSHPGRGREHIRP